ncbi:hypothetical protein PPACK8108_LOCUS20697 [Phakopsora pachyrhizi]|uniref:Uncharacterized protein n=1 Tax=Phakopsora pachyrhizi TaxID=170000 RepID=A0AAV0BI22_PHAPC|nr:hypothetical protein PPACK8108_LOCUS20697 [Phakopsora pachyrhizi]
MPFTGKQIHSNVSSQKTFTHDVEIGNEYGQCSSGKSTANEDHNEISDESQESNGSAGSKDNNNKFEVSSDDLSDSSKSIVQRGCLKKQRLLKSQSSEAGTPGTSKVNKSNKSTANSISLDSLDLGLKPTNFISKKAVVQFIKKSSLIILVVIIQAILPLIIATENNISMGALSMVPLYPMKAPQNHRITANLRLLTKAPTNQNLVDPKLKLKKKKQKTGSSIHQQVIIDHSSSDHSSDPPTYHCNRKRYFNRVPVPPDVEFMMETKGLEYGFTLSDESTTKSLHHSKPKISHKSSNQSKSSTSKAQNKKNNKQKTSSSIHQQVIIDHSSSDHSSDPSTYHCNRKHYLNGVPVPPDVEFTMETDGLETGSTLSNKSTTKSSHHSKPKSSHECPKSSHLGTDSIPCKVFPDLIDFSGPNQFTTFPSSSNALLPAIRPSTSKIDQPPTLTHNCVSSPLPFAPPRPPKPPALSLEHPGPIKSMPKRPNVGLFATTNTNLEACELERQFPPHNEAVLQSHLHLESVPINFGEPTSFGIASIQGSLLIAPAPIPISKNTTTSLAIAPAPIPISKSATANSIMSSNSIIHDKNLQQSVSTNQSSNLYQTTV